MEAKHKATGSARRSLTLAIMIVGTVVAVALAFGPIWMIQLGVIVSLGMAVASVSLAWSEVRALTKNHYQELREMRRATAKREQASAKAAMEIMDRFDAKAAQLLDELNSTKTRLAAAQSELATMRGNNVWLRGEIADRSNKIDELLAKLAKLDAARSEAASDSSVLALPRYGVASLRSNLPTAEELWADGNHPTIVEMSRLVFPEASRDERKQA